jgi:hypothetical protein
MPKFSIIAVDYDRHVPRPGMKRGLLNLANQTFDDFELIIVHDGPKEIPYEQEFDFSRFKNKPIFLNTPERMNNWGHSSRDMGMRIASGVYFLQFNIDNILYPDCLSTINKKIEETGSQIIIFTIIHHKLNALYLNNQVMVQNLDGEIVDSRPLNNIYSFPGLPPVLCNIDALQLVAHRDIWEKYNYWYDLTEQSDGRIYERICKENSYEHIPDIIAENF